jgi:hypothetical protein
LYTEYYCSTGTLYIPVLICSPPVPTSTAAYAFFPAPTPKYSGTGTAHIPVLICSPPVPTSTAPYAFFPAPTLKYPGTGTGYIPVAVPPTPYPPVPTRYCGVHNTPTDAPQFLPQPAGKIAHPAKTAGTNQHTRTSHPALFYLKTLPFPNNNTKKANSASLPHPHTRRPHTTTTESLPSRHRRYTTINHTILLQQIHGIQRHRALSYLSPLPSSSSPQRRWPK